MKAALRSQSDLDGEVILDLATLLIMAWLNRFNEHHSKCRHLSRNSSLRNSLICDLEMNDMPAAAQVDHQSTQCCFSMVSSAKSMTFFFVLLPVPFGSTFGCISIYCVKYHHKARTADLDLSVFFSTSCS
jgi:hypothetical protein